MTPAPSLTRSVPVVTAAAALSLVVHVWALYRDHPPPTLRWFPQADKVEHLVGFGLPCFLVLTALHLHVATTGHLLRRRTVALVVGLFLLHAVVSEVLQGVLDTTRSSDPFDALADAVGTSLGLLGYLVLRRRLRGRARGRA